jgi:hypothetical protein
VKIEWLNPERTKARLTKGWIWKKQAFVEHKRERGPGIPDDWYYANGQQCRRGLEALLDYKRWEPEEDAWTPVPRLAAPLPEARLLSERKA